MFIDTIAKNINHEMGRSQLTSFKQI